MDGVRRRFFFVSATLLTLGVVRGELATLLWGAFFALVNGYVGLGVFVVTQRSRASFDRRSEWRWTADSDVEHLEATPWSLELPRPLPLWPFFRWTLTFRARHGQRREIVSTTIMTSAVDHRWTIEALRGRFDVEIELALGDVFSIARTRYSRVFVREWVVSPRLGTSPFPDFASSDSGPRRNFRAKKRTDELLEVRKYVPGDDVRRLHWQLYAHSGEPFLRIGEETPPPIGKLTIVVDTTVAPSVEDSDVERVLDDRLEALRGYLTTLENDGWLWEVRAAQFDRVGGQAFRLSHSESARERWKSRLASLVAAEPQLEAIGNDLPKRVVLFSSLGSPGLSTLARHFSERNVEIRPLLHAVSSLREPSKRPWWRKA